MGKKQRSSFTVIASLFILSIMISSCTLLDVHPWAGGETANEELLNRINSIINNFAWNNNVPGLSIAVVQNNSILILRGYGDADRELKIPATPETLFRAYSIAKIFTALETVNLAEKGYFTLDDPVSGILPKWPVLLQEEAGIPITLRHLLTHRGGLPRNSNFHKSNVPIADCLGLQVQSLAGTWTSYPAGFRYKYSNIGFNILGNIIEFYNGTPFAVHMTNEVLPAYGMNNSTYLLHMLPPETVITTGYNYQDNKYSSYPPYDINEQASGNLYTSAEDMALFMRLLLEAENGNTPLPLSYKTLQSTYTPQFIQNSDPKRNGLGWMTSEELLNEQLIWHQGGDYDANSIVALMPESKLGITILTNCGSGNGESDLINLTIEIFESVTGKDVSVNTPPRDGGMTIDPEQISGRYIAYGEVLELYANQGNLEVKLGSAVLKLHAEKPNESGAVFSVQHWLDDLNIGGIFPMDLTYMRIIIPDTNDYSNDHIIIAVSDIDYEFCPRYPELEVIPESWITTEGEYDNCLVIIKDKTLRMTGVGYLQQYDADSFIVVNGIYTGERVTRSPATGSLFHQGYEYKRL